MPYNGIGIDTPRGTGTSGHIVRNLSHLRPREGPPGSSYGSRPSDFSTGANSFGPPVHRQPDAGILDHERKRKVEVKCFELREELEEKGEDESSIESAVSSLRQRLLSQTPTSNSNPSQSKRDIRNLKSHDSHALAAAKELEMNKMGRAFGIGSGHVEGKGFNRKDADAERIERAAKREESERARAEQIAKREAEKEAREAAFKEAERKRRREEYYRRLDEEKRVKEGGRGLDYDDRSGPRRLDRSPSPVIARSRPVGGRRPSDSRSRSPLPVRRERSRSPLPPSRSRPSISPPPRRRYSPSPSSRRDDHRARSRTPVDTRMKSRSPPPGVTINRPPPKGRPRSVSPSRSRSRPPPPARRRPDDSRSPPRRRRSASFNSDSSFSSDDSRSPPPRGARRRSRS